MTLETLESEITDAIPSLLEVARSLTRNKISDNYKLIFTEIRESSVNFDDNKEINKSNIYEKVPRTLVELMPTLKNNYNNFYDINLSIHKANKRLTIIDLQYYPKSSLEKVFRIKVLNTPPMLHYKVYYPPWLSDKKEKFDINWQHYKGLNWARLLLFKLRRKPKM